jgi:hypothetical protein
MNNPDKSQTNLWSCLWDDEIDLDKSLERIQQATAEEIVQVFIDEDGTLFFSEEAVRHGPIHAKWKRSPETISATDEKLVYLIRVFLQDVLLGDIHTGEDAWDNMINARNTIFADYLREIGYLAPSDTASIDAEIAEARQAPLVIGVSDMVKLLEKDKKKLPS